MSFFDVFGLVLLATLIGGWSAGLLGVFVIGLRMPFLTITTAHAALAGAVFAQLAGWPHGVGAFVCALAAAALLGWTLRGRTLDPNVALGTLFSVILGLTFLGLGLARGPRAELLGLLWGNILFVTTGDLKVIAVLAGVLLVFSAIFNKELKLLLFSREIAGLLTNEPALLTALLMLEAGVIAVNLELVGGLLLFSLIFNPAVAALRWARSYRATVLLSGFLGSASGIGGLLAAYWLDLPLGACIALCSALPVAMTRLYRVKPVGLAATRRP